MKPVAQHHIESVKQKQSKSFEELIPDMLQNRHNLDATMYNCLLAGFFEDGDEEMTPKTIMT